MSLGNPIRSPPFTHLPNGLLGHTPSKNKSLHKLQLILPSHTLSLESAIFSCPFSGYDVWSTQVYLGNWNEGAANNRSNNGNYWSRTANNSNNAHNLNFNSDNVNPENNNNKYNGNSVRCLQFSVRDSVRKNCITYDPP